ncbi:MAG: hypothetical protein GYB31_03925 [Bacteroidetes bacterium]|nr:hypothetical protein [Bacteroidota bacterium]
MFKVLFLAWTLMLQPGCDSNSKAPFGEFDFPYSMENPDLTLELKPNLNEISGLSFAFGESRLATINDEQGILFLLDPKTGEQVMHTEFHKPGDYEGIEVIDQIAYVVKSTGTIYEIRNIGTEGQEMIKHNGFLDGDYDVEGLGLDPKTGKLLLACKGKAGEHEEFAASRAIYTFDPKTSTFDSLPLYLIKLDAVRAYLDDNASLRAWEKLSEFFDPSAEDLTFAPSAIAVHPISGNMYLLSSVGKMMLVLDTEGNILHMEKLVKKIHPQPEGICFAADGSMYISNEAKGGVPRIYKFEYKGK